MHKLYITQYNTIHKRYKEKGKEESNDSTKEETTQAWECEAIKSKFIVKKYDWETKEYKYYFNSDSYIKTDKEDGTIINNNDKSENNSFPFVMTEEEFSKWNHLKTNKTGVIENTQINGNMTWIDQNKIKTETAKNEYQKGYFFIFIFILFFFFGFLGFFWWVLNSCIASHVCVLICNLRACICYALLR